MSANTFVSLATGIVIILMRVPESLSTSLLTYSSSNNLSSFMYNTENNHRWKRSPQGGSSDKCVLPPYPEHGGYVEKDIQNPVPGQVLDSALLNITCHPGYRVFGNTRLYCIAGFWSASMPKCVRYCKLYQHASVKYKCLKTGTTFENSLRECSEFEPTGTIVKPECVAPNYYYKGVLSYMRCLDSGWDYIAICTPECGRITPEGKILIIGGRLVRKGEFPWHAGIYTKTTTPFMQICGGSIVSNTVVVSAAHCFWNKQAEQINPASRYAVAVGKLYRPFNNPADVDAQRFNVSEIRIPLRFRGSSTNFQDDLAVVVLEAPIVYKTYVRPVCVDFDMIFEKGQLQDGRIGKVAGWGLTGANDPASPVLKVLDMPYVNIGQCIEGAPRDFREYITSDKICAGYTNGSALCHGDSGGGLVFSAMDRNKEIYYLRGVVSTAPTSDDACNAFTLTTFTQISVHKTFIEENVASLLDDAVPEGPYCVLPPYPTNGRYVNVWNVNTFPGQRVSSAMLDVICDKWYRVQDNRTTTCVDGIWSGDIAQCVRSNCRLIKDPSLVYTCPGAPSKECGETVQSGSFVQIRCNEPYYLPFQAGPNAGALPDMFCSETGWNNVAKCIPDCGKRDSYTNEDVPTTHDGYRRVRVGEFPWHVGIYTKTTKPYTLICGGTIVGARAVISTANCFWNEKEQKLYPAQRFAVAAGKVNRGWDSPEEEEVHKTDIVNIKVPDGFRGRKNYYNEDIAIIIVAKAFQYGHSIRSACVNYDDRITEGEWATVAGWGILQGNGTQHESQVAVNLPIISRAECSSVEPNNPAFIPEGSVCVGFTEGGVFCGSTNIRGGGLVLFWRDRFYLRGILSSTLEKCWNLIRVTDIRHQKDFIKADLEFNIDKF